MRILSALTSGTLPLEAEAGPGIWPYVIAGSILAVLVVAMLVLLAIGKGREHS